MLRFEVRRSIYPPEIFDRPESDDGGIRRMMEPGSEQTFNFYFPSPYIIIKAEARSKNDPEFLRASTIIAFTGKKEKEEKHCF